MTGRWGTVRFRKRLHVVPGVVYATMSASGVSWTLRLGPWSWNSRTRAYRLDLPGPLWWQGRTGRSPAAILAVAALALGLVGAGIAHTVIA
jgi:hypothetical protein